MLDSVSEKDRGYNYQEVIGDLASISDLVLVLFDPHKAGTIRESYASLRETLPEKTFEDRLIFVLNRIDECGNLEDLIRVYGTLCWNLSQMTGRKDIPRILMTYSQKANKKNDTKEFLNLLENQRSELQKSIKNAPKHRLDHLASFVEHHSDRMSHMLEALVAFNRRKSFFILKLSTIGLSVSLFLGALVGFYLDIVKPFGEISDEIAVAAGCGFSLILYIIWNFILYKYILKNYQKHSLKNLSNLTLLDTQARKDSWQNINESVKQYLLHSKHKSSTASLRKELELMNKINAKGAQEIRAAINALPNENN